MNYLFCTYTYVNSTTLSYFIHLNNNSPFTSTTARSGHSVSRLSHTCTTCTYLNQQGIHQNTFLAFCFTELGKQACVAPETVKSVTTNNHKVDKTTRLFSHVSHSDRKMYSKCINITSVNGDSGSNKRSRTYLSLCMYKDISLTLYICTRTYLSLCMYKDISLTLYICTRTYLSLCMYKDVFLTLYICTRRCLLLCTYVQGRISHFVHMYKDVSLTLYICTRTYLSLCTYVQGRISHSVHIGRNSHSVCSDVYHYLSVLEASGVRSCLVPITASISWTLIYQTNTEYT